MFGLAVWDRNRQELWLGRDRCGARTLYYTTEGSTRWIAPQLRTLNSHRSGDLDLIALRDYLCCAFVPGERTIWQQVRELRPGTILRLPDETVQVYWQLQERITAAEEPLGWHSKRLRCLLDRVVQEHLPAGEPVGYFTSNDASLIGRPAKNIFTFQLPVGAVVKIL